MRTVAYFTDSDTFGGAEQALIHLMAGLDRREWRPVLFHHDTPGTAPLVTAADCLGVERQVVPCMPLGRQGAQRIPGFVERLRGLRPAVFHAHLSWPLACKYALAGAILARIDGVVATAQLFVEAAYDPPTRLQQWLLAMGVGRYLAVSHALAQRLQQCFMIPRHKVEVIHNAVPVEWFARPAAAALRASLTGGQDLPLVLTVARLDAQKGHCDLLEAATHVPDAHFVLAGDGPERGALETQAAALGIRDRVHFLGHRTDIPDLLAACDLFVLPSRYEGLPLSVLEAMAAGKPVVASAIPGTNEAVIHGETGFLVAPGRITAQADAIRRLLVDPALARRFGRAGQARVRQEFSAETMVARVVEVYEGLLAGDG
jgi:glycosyltransferase involved in cell wall biosynthesis